ncbi:MAG: cytochrome c3 family protein [Desulfobacteraceae bacterium]
MKKGIWSLGVAVLAGLMFLGVGVLTAADVPDEIMISNEGYKTDKKGPVKLTHKKHSVDYKVACNECHHEYENGKNVWKEGQPVKKCADCHDPKKKQGKTLKLNIAYHKNCKNCHKEIMKKDPSKKAPFKKCNDCHQKK